MTTNGRAQQPNRATRLRWLLDRDGHTCIWCGREFSSVRIPTTDHLVPRVKGGPSWLENEVAACRRCNRTRGHISPVDWLADCERRGWRPDADRVLRALTAFADAVLERGGQRRARPYLQAQLRRMRRRTSAA
ncbi:HNH endonuclease [Actinoalloteichus hymeniacidonis]|uniref:HNH endonuclease n=1 Tax=Actinoalloteichus hymeniacidonis TaxID=340345 RepID=A0AAC9HT02_9PSEU|nr:HNH endonuclease [Actinoalloteichus hymeniacidonis]AOS64386.1 HNH endonuclease [Actinoalloteichus hymeniacidonis]MBB5907546.1 hypothetical protein [Actinoalloteichus hymeniacidonis]